MKRLLWLLLTAACFAQVQGNAPFVVDAASDRAGPNSAGSIAWPENVAVNDTIICGINVENDTGFTSSFTFSDSLANTWTATSPTTTPAPITNTKIWLQYTKSTSAGADTVTLSRTSGTDNFYMSCTRVRGLGTVDGAVVTQTSGSLGAGVAGTISTSNTTTTNNDLLFSVVTNAAFGNHFVQAGSTAEMIAGGSMSATPPVNYIVMLTRGGAAGSNTATAAIWAGNGSTTHAMQTLAFKPSAIAITDTVMPDAGVGVAYSAFLHGIGGIAAQTYSCPALPSNGLSLNASTGEISGSNPTAGTVSLSCTTTDGTTTSAAASLSISIGTLQVPSVRQYNNSWSGDNGGGSFVMNALCGSTILVFARGDDTHGTIGMVQAANGSGNKISDTFGTTWRRILSPITGPNVWPFVVYAGRLTQSGADTISVVNNQTVSSGRKVSLALEVTGANSVDDLMSGLNSITTSSSFSIAPSYTTTVNNVMLIAGTDSVGTLSISAPFNVISNGGDISGTTLYASAVISSASSTTATTSGTGGGSSQQNDALIVPLRPAIQPASCPAQVGTGEKIRRQVF